MLGMQICLWLLHAFFWHTLLQYLNTPHCAHTAVAGVAHSAQRCFSDLFRLLSKLLRMHLPLPCALRSSRLTTNQSRSPSPTNKCSMTCAGVPTVSNCNCNCKLLAGRKTIFQDDVTHVLDRIVYLGDVRQAVRKHDRGDLLVR